MKYLLPFMFFVVALGAGCRSNKADRALTMRDIQLHNSSIAIYTGDDRQDLEAGKDYGEFLKGGANPNVNLDGGAL